MVAFTRKKYSLSGKDKNIKTSLQCHIILDHAIICVQFIVTRHLHLQ